MKKYDSIAKEQQAFNSDYAKATQTSLEFRPKILTIALSRFANAIKNLNYDPAIAEETLTKYRQLSFDSLSYFIPQDFANSISAHAMLECPPDKEWLNRWFVQSQSKLKEEAFDPIHLGFSIHSLANLRQLPSQKWLNAWFKNSAATLNDCSPQRLSLQLFGLAFMAVKPEPEWLDRWFDTSQNHFATFDNQCVYSSLHALAILHVLGVPKCADMASTLLEKITPEQHARTATHLSQIILSCNALQLPFPAYINDTEISRVIHDSTKHESFSRLEHSIESSLKHLGFALLDDERLNHLTLSPVDFVAARYRNGVREQFLIQVDGPFHYLQSAGKDPLLNGSTQLNSHLIERSLAENECFLRLPYLEIYEALDTSTEALDAYVEKKINEAVDKRSHRPSSQIDATTTAATAQVQSPQPPKKSAAAKRAAAFGGFKL